MDVLADVAETAGGGRLDLVVAAADQTEQQRDGSVPGNRLGFQSKEDSSTLILPFGVAGGSWSEPGATETRVLKLEQISSPRTEYSDPIQLDPAPR